MQCQPQKPGGREVPAAKVAGGLRWLSVRAKGREWQLALSLLRTMTSARVEVAPFSRTSVICACEGREWHLVLEFAQQDGTS